MFSTGPSLNALLLQRMAAEEHRRSQMMNGYSTKTMPSRVQIKPADPRYKRYGF